MTDVMAPCPFCGGAAVAGEIDEPDHPDFGGHFIECAECGAATGLRFACGDDPRPLLAEQWNRRPTRRLQAMHDLVAAAAALSGESEELELDDGLGRAAVHDLWFDLDDALDAIAESAPAAVETAPDTIQAPAERLTALDLQNIGLIAQHHRDSATLRRLCAERDEALEQITRLRAPIVARPISEWGAEAGDVVWWRFPIDEPAWIGRPDDSGWPGYHTHWTPHPALPEQGDKRGG